MLSSISHGNKRMGWIAFGLTLSLMAEQAVMFAVPLIIYERTHSVASSGLAFALEWLPPILAYPFAGLLADRVGGPRLYRMANAARAACLLTAMCACFLLPGWTVQILVGSSVLLSVLIAPNRMAIQKTIAYVGPDQELAQRLSLLQNIELVSMAAGPGIAAAVAHYTGKLPLFGIASGAFLLAILCWRKIPGAPPTSSVAGTVLSDLALGWRLLFANRAVTLLAGANFSINLVFAVVLSANAFMITGRFHAPEYVLGMMSAGAGALGLINLVLVPTILRLWSIHRLGLGGFLLVSASLIALGLAPNVWVYGIAFLLAMAGVTLFNVFNRTERIKAIGKEHLGKVSGVFYLLNAFSYPLGGAITASVGALYGAQHIILGMAVLLALLGIPLLLTVIHYFTHAAGAERDTAPAQEQRVAGAK